MSLHLHVPDHVVCTDPWKLFCAECAEKMRIVTSIPTRGGREMRTYVCACGHLETIDVALPPQRPSSVTVSMRHQIPSVKLTAKPQSGPVPTIALTTRPAKQQPNPLSPSARDAVAAWQVIRSARSAAQLDQHAPIYPPFLPSLAAGAGSASSLE